jgi:hypothetical protein
VATPAAALGSILWSTTTNRITTNQHLTPLARSDDGLPGGITPDSTREK